MGDNDPVRSYCLLPARGGDVSRCFERNPYYTVDMPNTGALSK
jgi:hypothetical protein